MESYTWYATLIKPTWAPPAWLFGPVWSVLYIIIAGTFGYVFYKAYTGEIPYMVALPFILNLLFNAAFTPLQFSLRSNGLAALDITLVLITLVWALIVIYPYYPWVSYLNTPYLLWVCFATVLQFTSPTLIGSVSGTLASICLMFLLEESSLVCCLKFLVSYSP